MGFNVDLALTLAHCAVCSVLLYWRGSAAWKAHRAASAQQLESAWIREQCQNRTFYDNMRRVSTVCDDVLALGAPSDRALEAFFQYEPWMPLCLIPFTLLLCRNVFVYLRLAFGIRDYINDGLPK